MRPRLTGSADVAAGGFEGGHSSSSVARASAQRRNLRLDLGSVGSAHDGKVSGFALGAASQSEATSLECSEKWSVLDGSDEACRRSSGDS